MLKNLFVFYFPSIIKLVYVKNYLIIKILPIEFLPFPYLEKKTLLNSFYILIYFSEIYQKMNHSEVDSKKNFYGIQLLGVVILCNFPPYDPQEETRGMRYLIIRYN